MHICMEWNQRYAWSRACLFAVRDQILVAKIEIDGIGNQKKKKKKEAI